ncbi:DUF6746 family protein [Wenzhouxiangella limi]|uniref:Uncharacterized protein n=1 Tax=Wenzhouxiangella limi TaxID=2707351 RepID=A0A845V0X8_9GAMM|nr:DUF6746 family protein [Wenzhouxiangella limi]NDY95870.1 hypothetical protein [Wenzhouxiangella limi]
MPKFSRVLFFLLSAALVPLALASDDDDDRAEHFEGKPARTLEEALENFSEANSQFSELLSQDSLDTQAVFEVHELTYTLENALEKIRDEMEELAEVLEEVHLASERNDGETVKERGEVYLDTARKIIR